MANITGNNSNNNINGTSLADVIRGLGGQDYIDGGDGDDNIDGGNGNDILKGGLGNDVMFGGANNDRLNGGEGNDQLDGGTGTDWAEFDGGAAVTVDLTAGTATGQGNDTIFNIENVLGSSFNDTIRGNGFNNRLEGGGGDDTFIASLGSDIIRGDGGVDLISFAQLGAAAVVNLSTSSYTAGTATGTLNSVENVTGSALNDTITGNAANNVIDGGLGSDILNGGAGVDTLKITANTSAPYNQGAFVDLTAGTSISYNQTDTISNFENVIGSAQSDHITGNAGNNIINGGGATDSIFATMGVDHYDGDTGANDAVYFTNQAGVTANLATGTYMFDASNHGTMANIDHLIGGANNDTLIGDSANNRLDGDAGADVLLGGAGNDQLFGAAGSDRLIADGGNDELTGDYGIFDYGDDASDTFEVRTTAGNITIHDFQKGVDKLDLTDFNLGSSTYWTASGAQTSLTEVTLTLTGQGQEVVNILLRGIADGYNLSLNDMIGGTAAIIPPPPPPVVGGNGLADIFVILPQVTGCITISGFEDGLDLLDLTFLNQPNWDAAQGAASDGSVLLDFWNYASGDRFQVNLEGVGFGLIDQNDVII